MNRPPLVSVVTPCFNSARYLEQCIQSVLAQDYPHVEMVVQDGDSQDGSREILERYTDRIHWVSEPDRGQSDGLNKALQRCRGDIVTVLNADDELLPHAASWAVTQMAEHPDAGVIYGDQYNIDSEGRVLFEYQGPEPYDFEKVFCVEQVIPAQAAFLRREALEAAGWYADVTRTTCPDYEMWVRLGLKFPMRHVSGLIARYRLHLDSQGCQNQWIEEMVRSKHEVMERTFQDPATPPALRRLRRRAYAGALWWSADTFLLQGEVVRGLVQAARSLAHSPSLRQWRKTPGFLLACLRARQRRRARPHGVTARETEAPAC